MGRELCIKQFEAPEARLAAVSSDESVIPELLEEEYKHCKFLIKIMKDIKMAPARREELVA